MRAVVTGGAGFIGSHVVDALLERGDEVVVVDDLSSGRREWIPEAAELVVHDIRRPYEVEADTIFHLAAQADVGTSMARPGFDAEVNVVGTVNTLEAARACGARASSSRRPAARSTARSTRRRPRRRRGGRCPRTGSRSSRRGVRRRLEPRLRLRATSSCASPTSTGRASRPRSRAGSSRSSWNGSASGEETLVFGDGEQTRDFVYVGDVVERCPRGGRGRRHLQHRHRARDDGERPAPTLRRDRRRRSRSHATSQPRAGDARRSVLDASRAQRELGWRPRTSLADGLRRTWESIARKERGSRGRTRRPWSTRCPRARLAVADGDARRSAVAAASSSSCSSSASVSSRSRSPSTYARRRRRRFSRPRRRSRAPRLGRQTEARARRDVGDRPERERPLGRRGRERRPRDARAATRSARSATRRAATTPAARHVPPRLPRRGHAARRRSEA